MESWRLGGLESLRAGDLESGKAGELESMRPGELETLSKDSLARIPQPGIFKKICLGSPLESFCLINKVLQSSGGDLKCCQR